ncbi:MAG: hypothetical protein HY812_13480 [Planctomycetes bacterium]|nr:hypothetical protein [Planctomycetota bacterium]
MRTRRLLSPMLVLALLAAPAAQGETAAARLAAFVSRDTKTFVWVSDRAAFLRRLRRTDIVQALSWASTAQFRRELGQFMSGLSLFLPPAVLDAAPLVLAHGEGALALSVEGFLLEKGQPRPDVLFVAEASGFEGLVEAIAALGAGESTAQDALARFSLPFAVAADPPPARLLHRGVSLVDFRTAGGHRIVLAEHQGLLVGGRTAERVTKAIDRSLRRALGSLEDSGRFAEAWRQVEPEPGSVFCYANLRHLRQEEAPLLVRHGWARSLVIEQLRDYDGIALALRCVGDRFQVRAFLEEGATRLRERQDDPQPNRPFTCLAALPRETSGCLSLWRRAEEAAALLAGLNRLAGGSLPPDALRERFAALLGADLGGALAASAGGEFALFQQVDERPGPSGLAFLLEIADPQGVSRVLADVADAHGPRKVKRTDLDGHACYEVFLRENGLLFAPAFATCGRWLVGAENAYVLRSVLRRLEKGQGPGLQAAGSWLACFDDLDRGPEEPARVLLHLQTRRALLQYLPQARMLIHSAADQQGDQEHLPLATGTITVLTDPDVQDALEGLLLRAEVVPGGLRVEIVGP